MQTTAVSIQLNNGTERVPVENHLFYKSHGTEFTNTFISILLLLH